MRPPLLLVSLLLVGQVSSQSRPSEPGASAFVTPVPADDNLAAWRTHILPRADELRWETIPWLPTFGQGVAAADREGKPLLFWAMNGHPLGCT